MTDTSSDHNVASDRLSDRVARRTALLVWVGHDPAGGLEGTVERVRTGEKERFRGLAALRDVITRMVEGLAVAALASTLLAGPVYAAEMAKIGVVTTLEGDVSARRVAGPVSLKFRDDVFQIGR